MILADARTIEPKTLTAYQAKGTKSPKVQVDRLGSEAIIQLRSNL